MSQKESSVRGRPLFKIVEATSPEDRERVYRFRYQLYVEEMGRTQQYADDTAQTICEPLDFSVMFYCITGWL